MGPNLEVTGLPVAIWAGPQIKLFCFFLSVKWALPNYIVAQIRRVFGFGGGYPGAPTDLRRPLPLGQILGTYVPGSC